MQTTFVTKKSVKLTKSENPILFKRTIIEFEEKAKTHILPIKKNTTARFKYPTNGLYRLL
ncbi:MAG: hypothetical protein V4546_06100 [Bacteroidota bacterium]